MDYYIKISDFTGYDPVSRLIHLNHMRSFIHEYLHHLLYIQFGEPVCAAFDELVCKPSKWLHKEDCLAIHPLLSDLWDEAGIGLCPELYECTRCARYHSSR